MFVDHVFVLKQKKKMKKNLYLKKHSKYCEHWALKILNYIDGDGHDGNIISIINPVKKLLEFYLFINWFIFTLTSDSKYAPIGHVII